MRYAKSPYSHFQFTFSLIRLGTLRTGLEMFLRSLFRSCPHLQFSSSLHRTLTSVWQTFSAELSPYHFISSLRGACKLTRFSLRLSTPILERAALRTLRQIVNIVLLIRILTVNLHS